MHAYGHLGVAKAKRTWNNKTITKEVIITSHQLSNSISLKQYSTQFSTKMSERQNKEEKLARLGRDLAFYKYSLENVRNDENEKRRLLLAIRDVEREILATLTELRDITELENARMIRALTALEKMKNNKRKRKKRRNMK